MLSTPLAALVLGGCALGAAHRPPVAAPDPDARAAVLAAEDAHYDALARRDTATLGALLAPEFVLSGSAPELETRQQYLATAAMPQRVLEPIRLDDRRVRVYDGASVTTGRGRIRGTMAGRPFVMEFRFTNVYVARAGGWQVVASHLGVVR